MTTEAIEYIRQRCMVESYGKATPEELAQYPAEQTEWVLPMENGDSVKVYSLNSVGMDGTTPLIIYYHGGGFIKGRLSKDQLFCSRLAVTFHCRVWDVDYKLAPDYPYPTAVNEAYAVAKYAASHAEELQIDPEKILLIGHSAGGNLVATTCMRAGETGDFKPCGAIMGYAPVDLYTDPKDKPRREDDMPAEQAQMYNALYCVPEKAKDPYVSPLFASEEQLSTFPPILIFTGGMDSLAAESEELALRLARAGVETTCHRFVNSRHGFTLNRWDEWEAGIEHIHRFIRQHLV